jgi:hypothetical protein
VLFVYVRFFWHPRFIQLYNKHTCREVSPGLDVPREVSSGNFQPPEVRPIPDSSSCKYVWFLSHTTSHKHICSSSRYIRRCFVNIFLAKKTIGLNTSLCTSRLPLLHFFLWFFFSLSMLVAEKSSLKFRFIG